MDIKRSLISLMEFGIVFLLVSKYITILNTGIVNIVLSLANAFFKVF